MRCFIGIPLPDQLKNEIYESIKNLNIKHVKFVERENYHITLLFLGNVPIDNFIKITEKLKEIEFEKVELEIKKVGCFPSKMPRVIWLGVDHEKEIVKLHKEIVNKINFREDKRFIPHITIARIKKRISDEDIKIIIKRLNPLKGKKFTFDRFILYESKLTKNGPIYTERFIKYVQKFEENPVDLNENGK